MKTVTLRYYPNSWAEIQEWALDHCASYCDTQMEIVHDDHYRRTPHYHFSFANEADAVWFELKWGQ